MNVPMAGPEWEFEAADPEVGFLSDTVTHACEQNLAADDVQPAETADVSLATVVRRTREEAEAHTKEVVAETTTLRCPACNATTAYTELWPLWMFEEPRGDE